MPHYPSNDGDRTPPKRTIPLQVISPSMSRSGTDSMRKALELLGVGRTMHGFRLGERPSEMPIWCELVERKYPRSKNPQDARAITTADFDRVLGDCGATTDMPCAALWRELMDAYPDAKVVLVERDTEAWFRSFKTIVLDGMMSAKGHVSANRWVAWYVGDRHIEMIFNVFLGYFGARDKKELEAKARKVYKAHNEAVRRACKAEGRPFLEYKLGSGWEPLCEFLGVPVPKDDPFPSGNEGFVFTDIIEQVQTQRMWELARKITGHLSILAALAGVGYMVWRKPQVLSHYIKVLTRLVN